MSILFWGFAASMLIAAIGFVVVPLKTGKPLLATPAALIALLMPIVAVSFYALLGSPETVSTDSGKDRHLNAAARTGQSNGSLGTVASLVDGLRERLEREPDDASGWLLLAQSYHHLGRQIEAIDAYQRAKSLGKSDLKFEATLLGPGLAAQMNNAAPGPALRGRVSLSAAAAAQVQAGDTVFVFAKESRQQRMPVVAIRRPVADLPIDFEMTDKEIMVPGTQLSDFESLVVTATVSRSGNAADLGLGLEAWSDPVSPLGAGRIDLLIESHSSVGGTSDE